MSITSHHPLPGAAQMTNQTQTAEWTQAHEVVCITRSGFNFLRTEGADFAAKVTYQKYLKRADVAMGGGCHGRVIGELLIPRIGHWG